MPTGKLSEKASLTLEQFVAELKKRIQEKEKLAKKKTTDKPSTVTKVNESAKQLPVLGKPNLKQNTIPQAPKIVQDSPPTSIVKTPFPGDVNNIKKKTETKEESRVTIPTTHPKNDAKVVKPRLTPTPSLIRPPKLPSIDNKQTKIPNKKQTFPKIPIAGTPAPIR